MSRIDQVKDKYLLQDHKFKLLDNKSKLITYMISYFPLLQKLIP